jgi:hypothetical protein
MQSADDVLDSINLSVRGRSLLRIASDGPSKPAPRVQRRCKSGLLNCNRIYEPCSFSFCKRCCIKLQQTENSQYLDKCAFHVLNEITASKHSKCRETKTRDNEEDSGTAVLLDIEQIKLVDNNSKSSEVHDFIEECENIVTKESETIIKKEGIEGHVVDNSRSSSVTYPMSDGTKKGHLKSHKFGFNSVSSEERHSYRSSCKALLIGIGADEQMAGYGRHRSTFLSGGTAALVKVFNTYLTKYAFNILNNFVGYHFHFYFIPTRNLIWISLDCGLATSEGMTAAFLTTAEKPGSLSWTRQWLATSAACLCPRSVIWSSTLASETRSF